MELIAGALLRLQLPFLLLLLLLLLLRFADVVRRVGLGEGWPRCFFYFALVLPFLTVSVSVSSHRVSPTQFPSRTCSAACLAARQVLRRPLALRMCGPLSTRTHHAFCHHVMCLFDTWLSSCTEFTSSSSCPPWAFTSLSCPPWLSLRSRASPGPHLLFLARFAPPRLSPLSPVSLAPHEHSLLFLALPEPSIISLVLPAPSFLFSSPALSPLLAPPLLSSLLLAPHALSSAPLLLAPIALSFALAPPALSSLPHAPPARSPPG